MIKGGGSDNWDSCNKSTRARTIVLANKVFSNDYYNVWVGIMKRFWFLIVIFQCYVNGTIFGN